MYGIKYALSTALLVAFLTVMPAQAQSPTAEGRWTLGGSASFPFEYNKYRVSSFGYLINPEAGYLFADGLLVSGGVTLANILSQGYLAPPRMEIPAHFYWGFRLGVQYFFQTGQVVQPYLGLNLALLANHFNFNQIIWYAELPVGVAYFITPDIALDFSLPLTVSFSSTAIFEKLEVAPGYFGVRAFF
jgi:hypothetical protein